MCGIAGFVSLNNKIKLDLVLKMNNIAKYRGPDDEGYVLFGNNNLECRGEDTIEELKALPKLKDLSEEKCFMVFAHRRLSIIDLSKAGHQPMFDSSRNFCMTYNGEIYNYIEIRNELKNLGHVFRTKTDSEVILESYKEWGELCVNRFNGMWSFVIYDADNHKLFCSRDRLGAKPFHYYIDDEQFVFASEIKQICQVDTIPRELNEQYLFNAVLFHISDYNDETLIKNIKSLPGGYNLVINLDIASKKIADKKIYQYWDLEKKNTDSKNLWYEHLNDGINKRLRSDAPVGLMVSGGVDSSFLANEISHICLENGKTIKNIESFTSCYPDDMRHDETYYAHLVNEACGYNENLICPDFEMNTFDCFYDMVWHSEGLVTYSTLGSYLTLREIGKTGVKVIINGQGGDESMLGYERYYAYYIKDMIKHGKFLKAIGVYKQVIKHSRLTFIQLLQYIGYFNIPNLRKLRNNRRIKNFVNKEAFCRYDFTKIKDILTAKTMDELIYKELRKTQLTHILRMDDRMYMAFSLESRVPFIDYRYLEETIKINPEEKIKDGYTKYLLRERMQGGIPDDVVWRTNKNGWSSPSELWASRFDKDKIYDLFENARLKDYFNTNILKEMFDKNPSDSDVATFIVLEIFMRAFDVAA